MGLVAKELKSMREQLEQVTSGQASLEAAVGRLHEELASKTSQPSSNSCGPISSKSLKPQATMQSSPSIDRTGSIIGKRANVSLNRCFAKEELQRVLSIARREEEVQKNLPDRIGKKSAQILRAASGGYQLSQMGEHEWLETKKRALIDAVVGFIVLLNVLVVGASIDDETDSNSSTWLAIGFTFAALFWAELVIKVSMFGWRSQFRGPGALFNTFDAFLIVTDTVQLLLVVFHVFPTSRIISAFRIIRLLRLARLVKTFNAPALRDLVSMIRGMFGGMSTLAWSFVFLAASIYIFSLIFRVSLGPNSGSEAANAVTNADLAWYFRTVPRSMFTVFRCSFGDCSTTSGTPLLELITSEGGHFMAFLFCGFFFIMVIGMFNVISAIFVESTMTSAAEVSNERLHSRLNNPQIWSVNVIRILQKLMLRHAGRVESMTYEDWKDVEFPRAVIDTAVAVDADIQAALTELDIDPHTFDCLSDILDPDNGGTVGALELVEGLRRLRGEQRRGDIVAVDLMMRSLQCKVDDIWLILQSSNSDTNRVRDPVVLRGFSL